MIDQKPDPIQSRTDVAHVDQLPSDLRVPVSGSGAGGTRLDPIMSSSTALDGGPLNKKGGSAKWATIGIVIFLILLLAGTAYFLFGKANLGFNRGTLKLAIDPAGADIVIDGKFKRQSISSLSVKLKAGEHALLVTKEGYLDWEQEFTIAANEDKAVSLKLNAIPNIEVLAEGDIVFPELIRNGKALAYMKGDGSFSVIGLDGEEPAILFGGATISQIQSANWAPGEPMVLAKLAGTPTLPNMYDNRGVKGRFVPLGERPVQGAPRNLGTSSWLFDDAHQTSQGWQPVLLNESVGSFDFSPDGSRIIYFYATADGERSLVVAHPDGGEWERVTTHVDVDDPQLVWLNSDQYVLAIDANGGAGKDRVFDLVSKNFSEVMPDRIADTAVASSPDGTQVLYMSNDGGGRRLAVWNLSTNSRAKLFDAEVGEGTRFVWQTDNKFIMNKDDGSLWYWDLNGKEKPVQFISAVGSLQPVRLFYSIINHQLLVVEQNRVLRLAA